MLLRKIQCNCGPKPDKQPEEVLRNAVLHELEPFSFKGHAFSPVKVVKAYDGDTVKVAFLSPWTSLPATLTVRLWGIDAAEIAPRLDTPNRDTTRMAAVKARNRLIQLSTDVKLDVDDMVKTSKDIQTLIDTTNKKFLTLHCQGFDNFGRVLGVIYTLDGTCINKVLLDEKIAVPMATIDEHRAASPFRPETLIGPL
eukprot:jgi/Mesvir1/22215/Mv03847-RA.1